jgi:hypothetical protein
MIAGTLGPVASAFSICALVRPWRQSLQPGGDLAAAPFIHDPPWYVRSFQPTGEFSNQLTSSVSVCLRAFKATYCKCFTIGRGHCV